mgnify:CR=1 FL=1
MLCAPLGPGSRQRHVGAEEALITNFDKVIVVQGIGEPGLLCPGNISASDTTHKFTRIHIIREVSVAVVYLTEKEMFELMGLDLEMASAEHYPEVMETIDGMLRAIFRGLQTTYAAEITTVQKQCPHDCLSSPRNGRFKHTDAIKILQDAKVVQAPPPALIGDYDDMSTRTEKAHGVLVKEKCGTDYYIMDKSPLALRPFYTMPDASEPVLALPSFSDSHWSEDAHTRSQTRTTSSCAARRSSVAPSGCTTRLFSKSA